MKYIIALGSVFFYFSLFSQIPDTRVFDEIYKKGKLFTKPLKNGKIEFLKNSKPPKDT